MNINTVTKLLTAVIKGFTPLGTQHLITSSQQSRSGKRKSRKDSSRGKLNTPFSQFLEATRFIRSIIKYVFIIWALVLGVYTLFNFISEAAWQKEATEPEHSTVNIDSSPTTSNKEPVKELTAESANPTTAEISQVAAQSSPAQKSQSVATVEPDTEPALANLSSATGPILKVTAYSAILFDSPNDTQSTQTPLDKNSTVILLERQGEWIKVITVDKQTTGYVHSSQVTAN